MDGIENVRFSAAVGAGKYGYILLKAESRVDVTAEIHQRKLSKHHVAKIVQAAYRNAFQNKDLAI